MDTFIVSQLSGKSENTIRLHSIEVWRSRWIVRPHRDYFGSGHLNSRRSFLGGIVVSARISLQSLRHPANQEELLQGRLFASECKHLGCQIQLYFQLPSHCLLRL